MLKIFQSKIDKLVGKIEELEIKKQKAEDNKNSRCSKIERKITKLDDLRKQYQDQAQVVNNQTKALIKEIDREIEKSKKQITLEKEYYDDIIIDNKVKKHG